MHSAWYIVRNYFSLIRTIQEIYFDIGENRKIFLEVFTMIEIRFLQDHWSAAIKRS